MLKALIVTKDGKTTEELNLEEIPKLRINEENQYWYFNERGAMGFRIGEIPRSLGNEDYFLLDSDLYLLGVYDMEKEGDRAASRHAYGRFLARRLAARQEKFAAMIGEG